jgi:excisionase family DNA binding protein
MTTEYDLISMLAARIAAEVSKLLAARAQPATTPMAYSIKQAALTLSLSESTVEHMIRDRELPVIKRGTRRLISRDAIETWIGRSEI